MNVPGVGASLRLRLEEPGGRMMKPRGLRIRQGETTPHPSSEHYRKQRPELSCSSRASPASPFVRIDSSSCGSRRALPQSSEHLEPYTPSPEPRRTPTTAGPLRIGAATSLDKNIPRVQNPTTDRPVRSSSYAPTFDKWAMEPFQSNAVQMRDAVLGSIFYAARMRR